MNVHMAASKSALLVKYCPPSVFFKAGKKFKSLGARLGLGQKGGPGAPNRIFQDGPSMIAVPFQKI